MSKSLEQQISQTVRHSQQILIVLPRDWSIDTIGSGLALARLLTGLGKRVDLVADGFRPSDRINFLPDHKNIKSDLNTQRQFIISLDLTKTKVDQLTYHLEDDKLSFRLTPKKGQFRPEDVQAKLDRFGYDLIIAIGVSELKSLGRLFKVNPELFYQVPLVNLDRSPENEGYGHLNLVDITASSCAELVHRLYMTEGRPHDADTATLLLAGLIEATRSFRLPHVTPQTLDVAAQLVEAGGRRDEIVQRLYKTRSLGTLRLWGRALARLKYDPETRLVWSLLLKQDFIHAGAGEETLAEVMDELMVSTPQAELAGLIYEHDGVDGRPDGICALITSERQSDVPSLLRELKPQGNRRLARVHLTDMGLAEAEKKILTTLRRSLGKPPTTNEKPPRQKKEPAMAQTAASSTKTQPPTGKTDQPETSELFRELSAALQPKNLKPIDRK